MKGEDVVVKTSLLPLKIKVFEQIQINFANQNEFHVNQNSFSLFTLIETNLITHVQ